MFAEAYESVGASFVGLDGWETDFEELVEVHQSAGDS